MDTTTDAIAKLIAETRAAANLGERLSSISSRSNIRDELVEHSRDLADTLEAVTKERDEYERRWTEVLKLIPKKETL